MKLCAYLSLLSDLQQSFDEEHIVPVLQARKLRLIRGIGRPKGQGQDSEPTA